MAEEPDVLLELQWQREDPSEVIHLPPGDDEHRIRNGRHDRGDRLGQNRGSPDQGQAARKKYDMPCAVGLE